MPRWVKYGLLLVVIAMIVRSPAAAGHSAQHLVDKVIGYAGKFGDFIVALTS